MRTCISWVTSLGLIAALALGNLAPHAAHGWSTTQQNALREFSADVLMHMGAESAGSTGIGARVYVKQDDLYLDFPDLAHQSRIPLLVFERWPCGIREGRH